MTTMTTTSAPPRRLLQSVGAIFLGFIVVVALSLGADQLLHVLEVYPPWGQPMYETSLNLLALTALPCAWLGGALSHKKSDER